MELSENKLTRSKKMILKEVLIVACGGALGAGARYLVSLIPFTEKFPVATLIVNIVGAFLIGFLTGMLVSHQASTNVSLFWKTGLCGGFTTFSTFSLESKKLIENNQAGLGALYMILSLLLCVGAVFLGEFIGSKFAA